MLPGVGGLPFGGFIVAAELRAEAAIATVDAMLDSLKDWGATHLIVKPVPLPFCAAPSQDVEYALWRRGFAIERRELASMVRLDAGLAPSKSKARDAAHARKLGVTIGDASVAQFYPLLSDVLRSRHDADPVHSEAELRSLQAQFPDRIRVVGAFLDNRLAAGAVIFRYGRVWHTQYLASGAEGRQSNALDLLIMTLIDEAAAAGVDLSLGTSMQPDGLNEGLLWQKESFGARSALYDVISGEL